MLYLELDLKVHALHAFRQVLKHNLTSPAIEQTEPTIAWLESEIEYLAVHLNLSPIKAEKGLRFLEEGLKALHQGDYRDCIVANRRSIKLLGDWPPPLNNLSQALFFEGQPEAALTCAKQVLAHHPTNIQALGNAIRFLAWSGRETEAKAYWAQLRALEPEGEAARLKMTEAAAMMADDDFVYHLLNPRGKSGIASIETPEAFRQAQLYLAVAEANLGKRGPARKRFEAMEETYPWVGDYITALRAKQPGPGWAERFPYFHRSDMISKAQMEAFIKLSQRQERMPAKRFRKEVASFVARFPQIILVAEKLMWEEDQFEAGQAMLLMIANPAAFAALRRFGLSQAGDDEQRIQTLFSLLAAGEIDEDEMLRVWSDGEWQEVQLRQYEVTDEPDPEFTYAPEVATLLNQGLAAFKQDNDEQAEALFQRALTLEPRAKQAYNNLATLYSQRQDYQRAKAMFQKALEIDPAYVFPRCNLALFLLDEDDLDGAKAMIAPLAQVTRLHPQEMAFYSYLQARIYLENKAYDEARKVLKVALEVYPGYEPAVKLKKHLDDYAPLLKGWNSFFERQQERNQAKRAGLQTKVTTAEPSLTEALALYSKDVLTGMAREILPWGGWSAYRKAELLNEIATALQEQDVLTGLVGGLTAEERDLLPELLANEGQMPWSQFDARYGNDLEESPYWNYHTPKTMMGRLRLRGLLVEATVKGELLLLIPAELRSRLPAILKQAEAA